MIVTMIMTMRVTGIGSPRSETMVLVTVRMPARRAGGVALGRPWDRGADAPPPSPAQMVQLALRIQERSNGVHQSDMAERIHPNLRFDML
jgi:hypothetical protein